MIISKLDNAQNCRNQALSVVQECLTTDAGSGEARQDAAMRRELSEQTGICPYCQKPIVVRAQRHVEACQVCGRVIDSMMMSKSKLMRGEYTIELLRKMRKFYSDKHDFPYALRGKGPAHIRLALDNLIEAEIKLRDVKKELSIASIRRNLEDERKAKIRQEFIKAWPELTGEKLEEAVANEYVIRYYQDL